MANAPEIPLTRPAGGNAGPAGARQRPEAGGPDLILVVGHDSVLGPGVAEALRERWTLHRVPWPAAEEAARELVPDLVLADGSGAGIDVFLRTLHSDPLESEVPVLVVGPVPEGAALICDEIVPRNVAPAALAARVSAHLELARRRGESRLAEQAAREEAEAANRAKDEFIAMISHELRTPLGAILIWAQLLKTEELDAAATARAVGMIEKSTKNLAQLIDDLLDVSRIIAGKLKLDVRPVDLPSLIEAALDGAQAAAEARSISLTKSVEAPLPPVSGDAARLQQVVANLLSNAVKFTPEGGGVEVAVDRQVGYARIRVIDTGPGINPEFLPFIFDRFRQADTTSTRKQKGLGLGLAIARHIVELHAGAIEAASAGEGAGSTFTVLLPLMLGTTSVAPRMEATFSADLDGVRVLVVDDEEDARDAMGVLLEQAGARVTAVASAEEVLAFLASGRVDVLLSDIAMPVEDGYALIQRVRALPAKEGGSVPAAALTAYASVDDRRKALSAGFDEHIAKPVDPAHLVSALARLVASKPRDLR